MLLLAQMHIDEHLLSTNMGSLAFIAQVPSCHTEFDIIQIIINFLKYFSKPSILVLLNGVSVAQLIDLTGRYVNI